MDLYEHKILLVDDEPALRRMVGGFLTKAGFQNVVFAGNCLEAEAVCRREAPHLILLDVMLPDGDGFSLFDRLHRETEIPVIFLSARDEDESRLRGLGLGADDYITKPFLPEELILRVTAVLKRVYRIREEKQEERVVDLGDCLIDLGSGVVRRKCAVGGAADSVFEEAKGNGSIDSRESDAFAEAAGSDIAEETCGKDNKGSAAIEKKEVTLTAKEYAIIEKLSENRGRIVTIDALCDAVWKEGNYGYENTLIVHIRRLREKLEEDPSHPKHLLTARGLGYKLV